MKTSISSEALTQFGAEKIAFPPKCDGRTHGRTDIRTDGHTEIRIYGQTDGQK